MVDFWINDTFGIRVEPTWLSKGAKATQHNAYWGTIDGVVFNLDYIDVPVLARLDLSKSDTHPYVLGGLGVSFATKQEAELTKAGYKQTIDFGGVLSPTDLSVDLGTGVSLPLGRNRMTLDVRGAYGLLNINKGGSVTFAGSPLPVPSTATHTLDFRAFASYLFSL